MKILFTSIRVWLIESLCFGLGWFIYSIMFSFLPYWTAFVAVPAALLGGTPIFVTLIISISILRNKNHSLTQKKWIIYLSGLIWCISYSLLFTYFIGDVNLEEAPINFSKSMLCLASCFSIGFISSLSNFNSVLNNSNNSSINKKQMETLHPKLETNENQGKSNRILIKAGITGALILILLIPTAFVSNLVKERQARQIQVVNEVSNKWAEPQTLSGPYINLPYKIHEKGSDNKVYETQKNLIILPDMLNVKGNVLHEFRLRSIYKVLLYRANLKNNGVFEFHLPKEIDTSLIQWQDAKICYGLSDFKGVEEKLIMNFNGKEIELSPGLPSAEISKKGLSASVPLIASNEGEKLSFSMSLKIKGSEKLHFLPMAGDSKFNLESGWASPSFDGNSLPSTRSLNKEGFNASWSFNKANLPFSTVLKDFSYDLNSVAFGVTMVQPADSYSKTDRSIKYAILFIGLTFSLFFIIELMQKRSLHPVQYALIGLALVIFYTLLLSFSEFIAFDFSYMVAASATILLISFYSYSHFKSAKTALIFGGVLSLLYGFTFVLIRLEDAALLLGSIGLFIILALAMFASRKINWYS